MLKDYVPRPFALLGALLLISGAIVAIEQPWKPRDAAPPAPSGIPASELQYAAAPDFLGATGWINTPDGDPLHLEDLRGSVVLVDFWTYSCINCIHTFPHTTAWYARYKADNFTIVGVHTPEFRFERDAANVRDATARYNLTYPVAQDNDYSVWQAYNNRYWPAEYLVDAWGRVRHTSFGEGNYDETEQAIRQLLQEAGHRVLPPPTNVPEGNPSGAGLTSELYAGPAEGTDRVALGNSEGFQEGQEVRYAMPPDPGRDRIWLAGLWEDTPESVVARENGTQVLVPFTAGGANVVADGPRGACVEVLLDGKPVPPELAARDVVQRNGTTCLVLDGPRSYDFYAGPVGDHTVLLQPPTGFELFTFDFAPEGRK